MILVACSSGYARQAGPMPRPVVEGAFMQDSLKIGEPVPYVLRVAYPEQAMVLLPDSAYDYGDFHYLRRRYFPTYRQDSLLVDSVVFYLTTFELDEQQGLAIPAIQVRGEDSTYIRPLADSISLARVIRVLPDTVALLSTPDLVPVPDRTNWPLIYLVLAIILIVAGAGFALLAKPLRRWYRLRKLQSDYARFRETFDHKAGLSDGTPTDPEGALAAWKRYLESLDRIPYAKMTTREIVDVHPEPELRTALRDIDRHIYGGQSYKGEHTESYHVLVRIVEESYDRKLKEVRK